MNWGYDNVLPNEATAVTVTTETPTAAPITATVAQPASSFSPEEQSLIMAAPAHIQTQIINVLQSGITGEELHKTVMGLAAPVGNDAMVASPTTQGISDQIGILAQQANAGLISFDTKALEKLTKDIENRVKDMMLAGASKAEIEQSTAQLAYDPALASYVKQVTDQQYESNKNPFKDDTKSQDQGAAHSFASGMAALVGFGAAGAVASTYTGADGQPITKEEFDKLLASGQIREMTKDEAAQIRTAQHSAVTTPVVTGSEIAGTYTAPANEYGVTAARMPVLDYDQQYGSNTAALAALTADGGLKPQSTPGMDQIKILKAQQNAGQSV